MSISEKLNKIKEIKSQIKTAIINKGISVSDSDSFASYASKIDSIESGGSSSEEWATTIETSGVPYIFNRLIKKAPDELKTIIAKEMNESTSWTNAFAECYKLENLNDIVVGLNSSNVTNMQSLFNFCEKAEELNLSHFDTSKVTNMSYMFNACYSLLQLNLNNFDTSNVTTMQQIFNSCKEIEELDLSSFDTSKVTTAGQMFNGCSKLVTVKGIINMISMNYISLFASSCPLLTNINLKNLKTSGLDLSKSTQLSYSSLMYLINNAQTVTTTKTITLGATNLAKLSDSEKAIAVNKGWTLG